MTTAVQIPTARTGLEGPGVGQSLAGAEAAALLRKFPPRARPITWPATASAREDVLERLQRPPLRATVPSTQYVRMVGARLLLAWLETFPGETWQQRWEAIPATTPLEWQEEARGWARTTGRKPTLAALRSGLLALICADVIRPGLSWFTTHRSGHLRPALAAIRDPEGFARLEAVAPPAVLATRDGSNVLGVVARLLAAYGGKVEDIVVGDVLALWSASTRHRSGAVLTAYRWLRDLGQFPPDAPVTLRLIENRSAQVGPAELVDRYGLQCKPVRDLIVDYLTERRPSLDYSSLRTLSLTLAKHFWSDLEQHNPGIHSLHLPAETSGAWKERISKKTVRKRQANGSVSEVTEPRAGAPTIFMTVRAFYLDIAHWAADEPARWGRWAAPCPVREADCSLKQLEKRQKTWSDQRTRERLPVLPVLVRTADRRLKEARARVAALSEASPGTAFTVLGETFTAARASRRPDRRPNFAFDTEGKRRDLGTEEKRAFWAWATIEILRFTGLRIEELQELSHHSIVRYKLPSTGEIVPLLQVAPSKTDKERLLLIGPELADVLSSVVSRVRGKDGVIPSVHGYDLHERVWNPPMPLLFQWSAGGDDLRISERTIRLAINETFDASGLTDAAGESLKFQPHDFRRIFITDAILNGLPPHIAQVIAGHGNINTTMGYNAVYPAAAIEAHRAFIARRRNMRPSDEYRTVTSEEWEEFLGHFERRKLALGSCGRAYGTDCVHEHACVRCPVLIVGHEELPRLEEIRDNLKDRINEAEQEGWLGEVEGLSVSLAAAEEKINQIDERTERRSSPVYLGIPTFDEVAGRTTNSSPVRGD